MRLDFAQLDASATDLDLRIVAADIVQPAIVQPATQIAGAVHPRARIKRVADEALGRQCLTPQIPAGHPCTAQIQLTHHTQRRKLPLGIEHIRAQVRQRSTDGRVRHPRGHHAAAGHHRRLGRTVIVVHAKRQALGHLPQTIATDQQTPQTLGRHAGGKRMLGDRRGQEAHIQLLRTPPLQQGCHIRTVRGAGHHQHATAAQAWPDLPGRRIEAQTGQAGTARPLAHPEGRRVPGHQLRQLPMLDHHPLGLAAGTGGVDHIRQMRGGQAGNLRIGARQLACGGIVDVDQWQRRSAQRRAGGRMHQHRARGAVVQQIRQPLGRIGRVQGHIGCARLENGQQADDQLRTALHADRHPLVRPDAQLQQPMRQLVGPRIELAVLQALAVALQRHRLRCRRDLPLEQPVHGVHPLRHAMLQVEAQQTLALCWRQHAQLVDRRLPLMLERVGQLLQCRSHVGAQP